MENTQMVKGKILTKGLFTEKLVRLKIKNISPVQVPYEPGQYISFKISDQEYVPYYIFRHHAEINAFELAINIKEDSPGVNYIKSRGVGDDIDYLAPQGRLTLDEKDDEIYFICEGTYVSPFISYLFELSKTTIKPNLSLFWGVKDDKELFLVNTIYAFSTEMPHFSYDIFISDGTSTVKHRPGRVVDAISKVPLEEDAKIIVCGEQGMVSEVSSILKNKGIDKDNIVSEKI